MEKKTDMFFFKSCSQSLVREREIRKKENLLGWLKEESWYRNLSITVNSSPSEQSESKIKVLAVKELRGREKDKGAVKLKHSSSLLKGLSSELMLSKNLPYACIYRRSVELFMKPWNQLMYYNI